MLATSIENKLENKREVETHSRLRAIKYSFKCVDLIGFVTQGPFS